MAKAYWIGRVDVHNEEGYKPYIAANAAIFKKFGGRFVVRGGKFSAVEGQSRSRNVVIEFSDYDTALACYRSPEYQRAKPLRLPHSVCDFIIVEGYDGAQPAPSPGAPAAAPRKGYWIAHVDVTDPEGYKPYQSANAVPFSKFGARFLVRGGTREVVEGKARARTVVMEFPSYQAALDCYRSPEYQAAKALRKGKAEVDLFVIEGYDGPQS